MNRIILTALLVIISESICTGRGRDSLLVMFWNMENFFDYIDDSGAGSDKEFSSYGSRHWTKERFEAKCNVVSKTIYWISDSEGRLPDLIGLAEIENSNVLYRLLKNTALKKAGYSFIHYEGRDRRGIDVAFLYRNSVMNPLSITRKHPVYEGDTLLTRDILHVEMKTESMSSIDFIVNHHPSKFGGEKASQGRRNAAMACMKELCDSLSSLREGTIISMGDFNDTPDSFPFSMIEDMLHNKALYLHSKGEGTIRYEGKWDLIDMFLVSPQLSSRTEMEILKIPFLMVRDTKHSGEKPLRTYSGPRYLGGVSDHCPIILWIY